jgi:hypothetical protein
MSAKSIARTHSEARPPNEPGGGAHAMSTQLRSLLIVLLAAVLTLSASQGILAAQTTLVGVVSYEGFLQAERINGDLVIVDHFTAAFLTMNGASVKVGLDGVRGNYRSTRVFVLTDGTWQAVSDNVLTDNTAGLQLSLGGDSLRYTIKALRFRNLHSPAILRVDLKVNHDQSLRNVQYYEALSGGGSPGAQSTFPKTPQLVVDMEQHRLGLYTVTNRGADMLITAVISAGDAQKDTIKNLAITAFRRGTLVTMRNQVSVAFADTEDGDASSVVMFNKGDSVEIRSEGGLSANRGNLRKRGADRKPAIPRSPFTRH